MHTAGRKHRIINMVACVDATDTASYQAQLILKLAAAQDAELLRQGDVLFLTCIAEIWQVVYLTMKRREQRCSYNTQQMMKGAGGADTVEHDDHDDQIRNEEI